MKKGKKLLSLLLALVMMLSLFVVPTQAATKKVTNQAKSVVMVVNQKATIKPPVKMTYRYDCQGERIRCCYWKI